MQDLAVVFMSLGMAKNLLRGNGAVKSYSAAG